MADRRADLDIDDRSHISVMKIEVPVKHLFFEKEATGEWEGGVDAGDGLEPWSWATTIVGTRAMEWLDQKGVVRAGMVVEGVGE